MIEEDREIAEELHDTYTINRNGLITNLGKFEKEPLYVAFFYELLLEGDGEIIEDLKYGSVYTTFKLNDIDDDLAEAIYLPDDFEPTDYIVLWETADGFANHNILTERDYKKFINEIDKSNEKITEEEEEYYD